MFFNNHNVAAIEGKIIGQLSIKRYFGFCKSSMKITKGLRFHISIKTGDKQDNIYTTFAKNNIVKIDNISLIVPTILPGAKTQKFFKGSIRISFTLSVREWVSDKKFVNSDLVYQVDASSSHLLNSPKYGILAYQTAARSENTPELEI